MKLEDFKIKAELFGDFYVYYTKEGTNHQTYLVGTTDFSPPYIANIVGEQVRNPKIKKAMLEANKDGDRSTVAIFSYSSNKLRFLPVSRIRRLVPLSAILKNTPS